METSTSFLKNGGSRLLQMRMLSLNVIDISDADLNSTEHRIQLFAPQVH